MSTKPMDGPKLVCVAGCGREVGILSPLCRECGAVLQHAASPDCWCEPEVEYIDPETGAKVYLHRDIQ